MHNIMKLADAYAGLTGQFWSTTTDRAGDLEKISKERSEARAALEAAVEQQAAEIVNLKESVSDLRAAAIIMKAERDAALAKTSAMETAPKVAQQPLTNERIRLKEGEWPIISLGHGLIEVAEGWQGDAHALIFGRNGSGVIGAPTQPDRSHLPGETLAVVTFENVESLDVVAGKLRVLREKIAAHNIGGQQP